MAVPTAARWYSQAMRHLGSLRAAPRRICRLKLVHFDNLLVRHEFHEVAVVPVGVRCRLASPGRLVISYVSEIRNDPLSRASNSCRRQVMPSGTFHLAIARVKKRAIDHRAGRVHVASDAGRTHARIRSCRWRLTLKHFLRSRPETPARCCTAAESQTTNPCRVHSRQ
jgi:hypothetical protein